MASVVAYTKSQLIERCKRHMANGFANSSFSASDREVLLYIDQAVASTMIGQVFALAKVEGNLVMPEAYLTTYVFTNLAQNTTTSEWFTTLPQPPVSLPLGYSINRVYFASSINGVSQEVLPIKAKRRGYRNNMPRPAGAEYWTENSILWVTANDGSPLLSLNLYVQMAKTRTDDINETMAIPDDALEMIFTNVIGKLKDRLQLPQDIISDNLPSGNKAS